MDFTVSRTSVKGYEYPTLLGVCGLLGLDALRNQSLYLPPNLLTRRIFAPGVEEDLPGRPTGLSGRQPKSHSCPGNEDGESGSLSPVSDTSSHTWDRGQVRPVWPLHRCLCRRREGRTGRSSSSTPSSFMGRCISKVKGLTVFKPFPS